MPTSPSVSQMRRSLNGFPVFKPSRKRVYTSSNGGVLFGTELYEMFVISYKIVS